MSLIVIAILLIVLFAVTQTGKDTTDNENLHQALDAVEDNALDLVGAEKSSEITQVQSCECLDEINWFGVGILIGLGILFVAIIVFFIVIGVKWVLEEFFDSGPSFL